MESPGREAKRKISFMVVARKDLQLAGVTAEDEENGLLWHMPK